MPQLSPCAEIVRRLDYDRFVTTLFAPSQEREALAVLYAFNTEVARIRESVREPLIGHMRLKWWHDALDAVIAGTPPRHEVAAPLADVLRRYRLPRAPFDALIEARATDLDDEARQSELRALLDVLAIVVLASGLYLWIKKRNVSFEEWLASMQSRREPDAAVQEPATALAQSPDRP